MNTSEQKVSSVEINCKCEAQAKTAILNFLDKLGIKKIVYVDDRCSINELKEALEAEKLPYAAKQKRKENLNLINIENLSIQKEIEIVEKSLDQVLSKVV